MMSEDKTVAICAQRSPYFLEVEIGEIYWWCSCGRSQTQPLCDESHVGTCFDPIEFIPQEAGKVYLCGCKSTKTPPFCDGSHHTLDE